MTFLEIGLLSFLFGGGTGYMLKETKIEQHILKCPEVKKPTALKELVIVDCMEGCSKDMTIRVTPKTRGHIDGFVRDCIDYEETTNKLIDSYNQVLAEETRKLEKANGQR